MGPMQLEFFDSGKRIFEEGETGQKMYVVKEGVVELSVHGKLMVTIGKGGILGEMALIDNKPRSASARAKTDCELLPIDNVHFLSLVRQNPSFAIEVMKVLAERLRMMDELV
jgi:CRP/FNR family cyclic AMP-dependent transcriptional regulator